MSFAQSLPGSRPSNNSNAMDQNRLKRVREVEEEEDGRRVRRRVEEARVNFSRNQQSLHKLVEENERIAEDIVGDLEEKLEELTEALEGKEAELEDKDKLLKLQEKSLLNLEESHKEEMCGLEDKLSHSLGKVMEAELFNKEIMSTLNPDLVEALRASIDQDKIILELEEKLKIAVEKEERWEQVQKDKEKLKENGRETLKRLRGMNVTMVKTAGKPIDKKTEEEAPALKPGLNMLNIQAALNLMNATNNSGKRQLEEEPTIDEERSAKSLKLDNATELKVTLNEDEYEEEEEYESEAEADLDEKDDHDEEKDLCKEGDDVEEEEEVVLDPFWFCGPPSSELLRREEERLAEEKKMQEFKEEEMEKKKEKVEKEKEMEEGGCAPCFKGWVHFCFEDILSF